MLYIALLANQNHLETEEDINALPIPPNLKNLTPGLQDFVEFFELDPVLLKRAAEQSPDIVESPLDPSHLSEHEKNKFLQRVMNNDPLVSVDLRDQLIQRMTK